MALGGYLDSKGQVAPLVSHPALFAQVGWPGTGPLPPKLVENLLLGLDLAGNRLTHLRPGGRGWQEARK